MFQGSRRQKRLIVSKQNHVKSVTVGFEERAHSPLSADIFLSLNDKQLISLVDTSFIGQEEYFDENVIFFPPTLDIC